MLSDTFFKLLTDIPELELVREHAKPVLMEDDYEMLEQAVQFAIGADYITRNWMDGFFHKLTEEDIRKADMHDFLMWTSGDSRQCWIMHRTKQTGCLTRMK